MAKMRERLGRLEMARRGNLLQLERNAADRAKDRDGSATDSLASTLRFLGIAEFILRGNASAFQANLRRSVDLEMSLFRRFRSGDAIDSSYVTMLAYKKVLDALAACEFAPAHELASSVGGRTDIEKVHDHPFDRAFGYALKACVLESASDFQNAISQLTEICHRKGNEDFNGYQLAMRAIVNADSREFERAMTAIIDGHINQSKFGVFADTVDELLCVWGLGLFNLARSRGIDVMFSHSLIPEALVLDRRG